ncbi:MAG: hypothetical protein A2151_06495 [Candidatus Muproteobacteria bacterium RBG_16_65_34]|uniref:CHASE2 domain-containing protein n=1 Tax=Candidatus Muproteobacteria bacterium RBG_16_65_34 TaxID=1817760 RepID=A0A1F6TKH4_9PROT|nr:MAG: hypothetical protein A2151_06495 [Candidatus Muproteobacteria bacterium RBG_16_65_34]
MPAVHFIQRLVRSVLLPVAALSDRLGNLFYVGLAAIVIVGGGAALSTGATDGMKSKVYDLIMKYRFRAPAPDPDIVLVDIDEAALAAMAPEFGRWPWPRNIMGELVEGITPQKPKAIVFDITFADPDVFNAAGDRYLRDALARTPNTYFPMIRLGEEADAQSALKVSELPGVVKFEEDAPADATVAAVLPFFYDALTDNRLGANNLDADADGIVRHYPVYLDAYGWRIGSLPANVAAAVGAVPPAQDRILLNWRGRPLAYPRVSFHEVYFDLLKKERARPQAEFTGKVVIIGSTAPALFDMRPTPMAKVHPGAEILATALDNLKNGDSLTELPRWIYILTTLVAVSLLAAAFVYSIDQRLLTLVFTVLQSAFLAASYLTLNFSTVFVDLTAPFAFTLLYFSVARFNSTFLGYRRSGHALFSAVLDRGNECRAILAQCHFRLEPRAAALRLRAALKKEAGLTRLGVVTAPLYKGTPLLHSFFQDTLLLYWLVPAEQERAAFEDAIAALARMRPIVERHSRRLGAEDKTAVTVMLHALAFKVDEQGEWRLRGEEALGRTYTLAGAPAAGGAARIVATEEFKAMCRGASAQVPETLGKIGLQC